MGHSMGESSLGDADPVEPLRDVGGKGDGMVAGCIVTGRIAIDVPP